MFPPKSFIISQKNKIERSQISHYNFSDTIEIFSSVIKNGIKISLDNYNISLSYPRSIWQKFPLPYKKNFSDNIAFAMTFHLPFLFPQIKKIAYKMPVPICEPFLYKCFLQQLPATAMMETNDFSSKTSNLLRCLFNIDYTFYRQKAKIPTPKKLDNSSSVVMLFTFGKDSLLTFALCQELGINTKPVFVIEPNFSYEEILKKKLAKDFQKEYNVKIEFFKNALGVLRDPDPNGLFGWEIQLSQYSLLLLPFVYGHKAHYLFFSDEQSCDSTMVDADGFRCNPVYEQSHQWLLQNGLFASLIAGNSLSIGTLIEPLHDLAIIKILHHRYPEFGKYQSSCDVYEKPKRGEKWCENCSKCARIYIMLLANGIDPTNLGFKTNLLRESQMEHYALFNRKRPKEFSYDNSSQAADEQKLAFLLAFKLGVKGPLMDIFKRKFLKGVLPQENQWRKIFFGIHSTLTVPKEYLPKVLKIYRQELKSLY